MHNNRNDTSSVIPFDLLATHPESLVQTTNSFSSLPDEYDAIKECKCCREFDRTDADWNKCKKLKQINLPSGFITPLDFFERITSAYLAKQLHHLPEIHMMSLGSGQLLRELIIIAKLIKELNDQYSLNPKIILHAVDQLYKKKYRTSDVYWLKASSLLCHEQFKKIIAQWNVNVELHTYSSLEKYNHKKKNRELHHPEVILSIDLPVQFDVDFPEKSKTKPSQDFQYTQQGILKNTKDVLNNHSICITITHYSENSGIYIIIEKKENKMWHKEWIYTVSGNKKLKQEPSPLLQEIIKSREDEYQLSETYKQEQLEKERFKLSPLSYLVKEKLYLIYEVSQNLLSNEEKAIVDTIDRSLKSENVNAQCTQGFTALHWAAMARDNDMIKKLIAHGADPSSKNCYGRMPVDYYQYQIQLSDFKDTFQNKDEYQDMLKEYNTHSNGIMPEFSQLYIDDSAKSLALYFRNNILTDISLFNLPEIKDRKSTPVIKLSNTPLGLFTPTPQSFTYTGISENKYSPS